MHPHELAFVENFIVPARRDRFLDKLESAKKREAFLKELHHLKPNFLLSSCVELIVPSQHFPRFLGPKLRSLGAAGDCRVFGNYIDAQEMKLEDALEALVGYRTGTIISCVPGKLAFLESEDERMILRKP